MQTPQGGSLTRRILVAGSDEPDLDVLRGRAQAITGAEVVEARTKDEALQVLRETRPDLVVLDASIGASDVLQVVGAMRADAAFAEIPILAVVDGRPLADAALERGADDVAVRPLNAAELSRRFELLGALGGARTRIAALLASQTLREREHASRLESLWKIAASALDDDAYVQALLEESSRALRVDTVFHGALAHLDGADLVIDFAQHEVPESLQAGTRTAINDTIAGELLREGRTAAWSDVPSDPRVAGKPVLRIVPWRAFIGTPFRVGATLYFIMFCALTRPLRPFDALDRGYVETLASFCASRLQQRAELERMRYQVDHDALTGVLNRATFRARGFAALRDGGRNALVVIDVDRFREINDTLGHQGGDSVLVEIAGALRARAGDDELARLSGDSFGVLMRDVGGRDDVEHRLQPYTEALAVPFRTGDRDGMRRIGVTASIGIAIAPEDGVTFEQLLARAESATYAAKEAGRARRAFFDPGIEERFALARQLQNDLAHALVRDELALYFQPHIDLTTRRVAGAEALIRWNHPERGLLQPAEFLPFAERHNMLAAIGSWVMRHTVGASRAWRQADPNFRVWFNLSADELGNAGFLARLHEFDGDLDGIGVEITEAVAMRDVAHTQRSIAALRDAGVRVALDDFGTGYSSLAQLKRLPIDVVKIDGAFVAGLPNDVHDAAIVDAVVGIGQRFGFEVVAEGVETAAQAAWLKHAGCTYGQGFQFARPMPAAHFASWLHAGGETPGVVPRT